MKKVSIVIPVYKVREYINDCLKSVFNQTYNNIEVVLVNDCTPDDTMEVAKEMIKELQARFEVRIINHEVNKGPSDARNNGVKAATGDYIYFLDSDDEITDDCIELLCREFIKYPNITFSIGGFINIYQNRPETTSLFCEYISSNEEIFEHSATTNSENPGMACNRLIRRDVILSSDLWFEKGLLHEDLLYTQRLLLASTAYSSLQKGVYKYKHREVSRSTSRSKKDFSDMLYIVSSRYKLINEEPNKYPAPLKDLLILKSMVFIIGFLFSNSKLTRKDEFKLFKSYINFYDSTKPNTAKLIQFSNEELSIISKCKLVIIRFLPVCLSYCIFKIKG